MKIWLIIVFCCLTHIGISQKSLIPDKQFMVGVVGVGSSEVVRCYIHSYGGVLYRYDSEEDLFQVDSDSSYSYDYITLTGNSDPLDCWNWPGWNFSWLNGSPYWNLGVYRVFNSKNTGVYFFLDARDYSFGTAQYNPDFFILYNSSLNKYYYRNDGNWIEIANKSTIKISEIHGQNYNVQRFSNWWSNVLCGQYKDNTPMLVWGKYTNQDSVTRFLIYKKIGNGSWGIIDSVSSSTFYYNDSGQAVYSWGTNGVHTIYYKVICRLINDSLSSPTNEVNYGIGEYSESSLDGKYSETSQKIDIETSSVVIYPNPFNPSTTIKIWIPQTGLVSIKLYDVSGKEVLNVLEATIEKGDHIYSLGGGNLSSGIYFLRMITGGNVLTKRIILQK
jgi:hypothetical protein